MCSWPSAEPLLAAPFSCVLQMSQPRNPRASPRWLLQERCDSPRVITPSRSRSRPSRRHAHAASMSRDRSRDRSRAAASRPGSSQPCKGMENGARQHMLRPKQGMGKVGKVGKGMVEMTAIAATVSTQVVQQLISELTPLIVQQLLKEMPTGQKGHAQTGSGSSGDRVPVSALADSPDHRVPCHWADSGDAECTGWFEKEFRGRKKTRYVCTACFIKMNWQQEESRSSSALHHDAFQQVQQHQRTQHQSEQREEEFEQHEVDAAPVKRTQDQWAHDFCERFMHEIHQQEVDSAEEDAARRFEAAWTLQPR